MDECQSGLHRCGEGQLCHNLPGSYRCECQTGYQYDSFRRMCVGMLDIIHITMQRKRTCCTYSRTERKVELCTFCLFSLVPQFHARSLPSFLSSRSSSLSHYCTATPLLCLPLLLLLFIILRWESCCCMPASAAGSCSSHWADHVSCCRGPSFCPCRRCCCCCSLCL